MTRKLRCIKISFDLSLLRQIFDHIPEICRSGVRPYQIPLSYVFTRCLFKIKYKYVYLSMNGPLLKVDGDREEWSWWKVNMMKGGRDDMARGLFRCVPGCQMGWIIDVREKRIKKKRRGGRVGWIDGRDKMFPSYCLSPPSSLFKNEHRTDNKVGGFLVVFFPC